MTPDFEAIEKGLFAKLQQSLQAANLGYATIGRWARVVPNVGIEMQPAFFLIPRGPQITQRSVFGASEYKIHYKGLIYSRAPEDPAAAGVPQTFLNQSLTAIGRALDPIPGDNRVTLGLPQVIHVWIEGDAPLEAGNLDPQCAVEIPIWVLAGS